MAGRRVPVLVLAALVALVGCTDDEGPTTAGAAASGGATAETGSDDGGSADEPVAASPAVGGDIDPGLTQAVCPDLAAGLIRSVRPADEESTRDDAALQTALERLAEEAPDPLGPQARAVLADDGATPDATLAVEGIHAWALGHCAVEDEPAWSCLATEVRYLFDSVGAPIAGEGEEQAPPTTAPGAATPEEVYGAADQEGDPVEVSRTEDEVLVAWLDDQGRAVSALTAVDEGGWRADVVEACIERGEDGAGADDDFVPIGGPIEPGG